MATEDTELTFIRCPSCRSLIPAVANRCRMCGHALEESPAMADSGNEPKVESTQAEPDEVPFEQSLNNVLQTEAPSVQGSEADVTAEHTAPKLERFDSFVHGQVQEVVQGIPESIEPESAIIETGPEEAFETQNSSAIDDILDRATQSDTDQEQRPKRKRKRKKKRRDSTGSLVQADTGSLITGENGSVEVNREVNRQEVRNEAPRAEKKPPVHENRPKQQHQNRDRENRSEQHVNEPRRRHEHRVTADKPLIAWFINFENPNGEATEIREGRFFISGSKVKESDMVIRDKNLSSPHCLVKAEGSGVMVQDLLSDEGTCIKKSGSTDYKALEVATVIENGDFLKLGDFEVMLCLLPDKEAKLKKSKKADKEK